LNSVTLWDKIINSPEEAKLHAASQKYRFTDITGSFDRVNATYALHWNVVPWVGVLQWGKASAGYIKLPEAHVEEKT